MAMECPEFWRIEGNVKRRLRRLKSLNNNAIKRELSMQDEINQKFHRRMTSKGLKKQEVEDEEIRQMIKQNLENPGVEDIIDSNIFLFY